jgi:hypothetical protein
MSLLSRLLPRSELTPPSLHSGRPTILSCMPRLAIAVVAAVAATGSTGTAVLAGTLSITAPASTTLPSTAISVGTVTAGVNAANWADTVGSNVGWNGTLAVQRFHVIGTNAWAPGASHVLANNNSGQYTGATQAAAYTVTVTAASAGLTTTVAISWSGEEAGVGTATKNTPFVMGARGMTIDFLSGQAYATTDVYTARVGNLATSALSVAQATTVITLVSGSGGTNLPTATGGTSTVTSGTTSTYSATPVKVVTAANTKGVGTFTVTPGVTLTWDPNNTWALPYTASAQYTIASGP